MKEILDDLDRWRTQGKRVAIARVIDVDGSGPRLPGAAMAVSEDSEVAGSVSGGCVEGAVVTEGLEAISSGDRTVVTFGYSDDDAFAVGLTCGGTIHLYVEPLDWWSLYDEVRRLQLDNTPFALATVIEGPNTGAKLLVRHDETVEPVGSLGDPDLDRVVALDARFGLAAGTTAVRHYGEHGDSCGSTVSVFIESFVPPPRMLIFGAVDFTAALARVAKVLGYHVTVCDARPVFATRKRFPMADAVVAEWPHRLLQEVGPTLGPRDAVCVLTHDAKFDVPAIVTALGTDVGYLGAMGSRRTHADRVRRLKEEGVDDAAIARVLAPIGLDLGARTPEETAVSICAEIIAARAGRTGAVGPLRDGHGPIHA
ncbi:XdhC family protein [Streptomyces sp. NPDC005202]|uniref:XdhC family protein n=1 Tax=Streptomyces sp. NPDC005202 TaxID=3157021 RepID=UPI00339DEBBE